jgi:hypothetical protein
MKWLGVGVGMEGYLTSLLAWAGTFVCLCPAAKYRIGAREFLTGHCIHAWV